MNKILKNKKEIIEYFEKGSKPKQFWKIGTEHEKFLFDLRGFINKEISNSGVTNIENLEMDTFSQNDFFYSYRRSQLNKEKDYGRCISVILMT